LGSVMGSVVGENIFRVADFLRSNLARGRSLIIALEVGAVACAAAVPGRPGWLGNPDRALA